MPGSAGEKNFKTWIVFGVVNCVVLQSGINFSFMKPQWLLLLQLLKALPILQQQLDALLEFDVSTVVARIHVL